jgi:hypothetical protein
MTTQEFFTALADWLLADPSHLVTAASGMAALIPTPAPDSLAGKFFKIIDILALNILHAKESGQTTPPTSPTIQTTTVLPAATLSALALLLSACAGQTPQKDVFELRAAYDASVLAPLVRYHSLPLCGPSVTGACKNSNIDEKLIVADGAARTALDAAETAARTPNGQNPQAVLVTAQNAIAAIQAVLADNGMN